MKKLFLFLLVIPVLFQAGCGSVEYKPPTEHNIVKDVNINKPFEDVWNKTVQWFATHNSPIKTMDKSSGLIATDYNLTVDEYKKYSDCGSFEKSGISDASFTEPLGNFNILISKNDENSTKVSINCFFSAKATASTYDFLSKTNQVESKKVTCVSTGVLEKIIFDYLNQP